MGRELRDGENDLLLRDIGEPDLAVLFAHQLDSDATRMAAFPSRDQAAFTVHWAKVLADPANIAKAIVVSGEVAGYVSSWAAGGERLVGYWIGKDHWGKGIASRALRSFLEHDTSRPLRAHVAKHNVGSIRVLEKCGFRSSGEAAVGKDGVEELVFVLEREGRVLAPLVTPRLRLRRFGEGDLAAFLAYRNHPDVARYQSWDRISEAEAVVFLREQTVLDPGTAGTWFQLAVCLEPGGELVGDCALHTSAGDARLGEIGFAFDPTCQGKGLATEAVAAVIDHAFGALGMHRLQAVVDCRNGPAIRLLERLGMRREGHFLQHTWFKGAWADELLFALLASEWRGPCA